MNLNALLNIFFPPTCIFCAQVMDYRTELCVCDACMNRLPLLPDKHCEICLEPLDIEFGDRLCKYCKTNSFHFDKIVSPYLYDECVRDSILRLKFHKHIDYAKTMAVILAGQVAKELIWDEIDCIIPVPISKQRFRERQYNQCEIIAGEIARILHIPYCNDILFKHKDNVKQSTLTAKQRRVNVKGAYSVKDGETLSGKHILLIDDATTTRATLDECAKILKKSGATIVQCAVFAVSGKDLYSADKKTEKQETPVYI